MKFCWILLSWELFLTAPLFSQTDTGPEPIRLPYQYEVRVEMVGLYANVLAAPESR